VLLFIDGESVRTSAPTSAINKLRIHDEKLSRLKAY
jgi:hypothetical protein